MKSPLFRLSLLSIATLASVAASHPALAGEGAASSGGGNAVVCFPNQNWVREVDANGGRMTARHRAAITSITAYDLWDATGGNQAYDRFIQPLAGETPDAYALRIAKRMEISVPGLAQMIRDSSTRLIYRPESRWAEGLTKVDDITARGNIPVNCLIATIVKQTQLGNAFVMDLDDLFFDTRVHSDLSRGVLILHEWVYLNARIHGATNSDTSRALVAAMIDPNITLGYLAQYASDLKFPVHTGGIYLYDPAFHTVPYSPLYPRLLSVAKESSWLATRLADQAYEGFQTEIKAFTTRWHLRNYFNGGGLASDLNLLRAMRDAIQSSGTIKDFSLDPDGGKKFNVSEVLAQLNQLISRGEQLLPNLATETARQINELISAQRPLVAPHAPAAATEQLAKIVESFRQRITKAEEIICGNLKLASSFTGCESYSSRIIQYTVKGYGEYSLAEYFNLIPKELRLNLDFKISVPLR